MSQNTQTPIYFWCFWNIFLSCIDSHPQQQEQSSKSHKQRSHGSYQELFEQLPGKFDGGELVDKEPSCEEETTGLMGETYLDMELMSAVVMMRIILYIL